MTEEQRYNMCGRKKVFRTMEEVQEGIQHAFWNLDSIQRWYKCPICGHYHLTSSFSGPLNNSFHNHQFA